MVVYEEGIALDPGVMLYPGRGSVDGKVGDHVIIAPPYNVTEEQINSILERTLRAIDSAFRKLLPQIGS